MNTDTIDRAERLARLCVLGDSQGLTLYHDAMVREYEFARDIGRKWRFDLAWPLYLVAVEVDGFGPGHYSKHGRAQDNYKANAATLRGWYILRYSTEDLRLNPVRILQEIAVALDRQVNIRAAAEEASARAFYAIPKVDALQAADWPKAPRRRKPTTTKRAKGRRL